MLDDVINRKAFCLSRFFQSDLRGQNRARIANSDQKLRMRKARKNCCDVIAIGRCFFDPAFYSVERNAQRRGIRLDHENEKIALCVRGIEGGALERLEKFLLRKTGVLVASPFRFTAKQDA